MEAYWLLNFLWDSLLMSLAARSLGYWRLRPVLVSAALGATLACLSGRLSWPVAALAPLLMSLAASLRLEAPWRQAASLRLEAPCRQAASGICRAPALALRFLLASALAGGISSLIQRILGGWSLSSLGASMALCAVSMGLVLRRRTAPVPPETLRLRLLWRRRAVEFPALVDTGNRLREPLSGLPVLVAEEGLLRPLLPPGCDPAALPRGFRLVGYGGVGGSGRMPCFRPDRIQALRRGAWRDAPDAWVALYPGKLPGRARALAPGDMAME